jgi:hypothetical protein
MGHGANIGVIPGTEDNFSKDRYSPRRSRNLELGMRKIIRGRAMTDISTIAKGTQGYTPFVH